ncbi:hypothetical protein [Sulfitobacter pacificus]|uniref:hypothetical protein n=1 Tax=Sulfitobacter pacificus TaxID=1499314 RepID=UPI00310C1696
MQIFTYTAEAQQAAKETLKALEEVMLSDLDRQIDEEGCGAFMNAYFYQNEIDAAPATITE